MSDPLDDMVTFKAQIDAAVFSIGLQPDLRMLRAYWDHLAGHHPAVARDARVIKAKDARKAELRAA